MRYTIITNEKFSSLISLMLVPAIFLTLFLNFTQAQNLLASPECVSFDNAHNRYLVSCYQSGNIVQIDSNGIQSNLLTGFGHVLSNTIHGNIFYFSVIHGVKGYDISVTPPPEVMNVSIPSSIQLDGMTTDTSGNLYVCDFDYSGPNDRIFKINLTSHTWSLFVPPGHVTAPQDIEYDIENNRLIVANWQNSSPIQAVSLVDSIVTNLVASSIGNFDGIARDTSGNYYFTSWTTGSVHRYDRNFVNSPVVVVSGFSGPSNLSYNPRGNLLVIPDFNLNTITLFQLSAIGIKKISGKVSLSFNLSQNYPNPFNPSTKIKFEIPRSPLYEGSTTRLVEGAEGFTSLKVFNILGQEVAALINERLSPGYYEITWDASRFPGGVYFYKLITSDFDQTKKMIYIK